MMNLRKSCLPPGWYPQNTSKISDFLGNFARSDNKTAGSGPKNQNSGEVSSSVSVRPGEYPGQIIAAVAPHAGWYYSGAVAAQAVSALAEASNQNEIVAVIGGHLSGTSPCLIMMEDAVSTHLGNLEIDDELRKMLITSFGNITGFRTAEDRYQDNTVEVLLPMVKYFFPLVKLLWLRFPATMASFEAGKILAKTAASLDKKLLVLGSTDLTHYGPNYGFSPEGYGQEALNWVKNVNDRRFIDAVEKGDPEAVLERAHNERSSCSAGAVLGVMGYAEETRSGEKQGSNSAGKLLAYSTSADIARDEGEGIPDSFVGYGAFIWSTE